MSFQLHTAAGASSSSSLPATGILTPSSEHSAANRSFLSRSRRDKRRMDDNSPLEPPAKRFSNHDPMPGSRKTSHEAHPMEELLKPTISVTPHPRNLMSRARTLQPLMLLRREDVPLSYLDLSNPNGEFVASRFVESHIKPLDLEGRLGSRSVALLAVSESTGRAYILERHQNGVYVVCKLGSWVEIEPLGMASIACCQQAFKAFTARPANDTRPFALPHTTPHDYREEKKKQRAIEELKAITKKSSRRQMSVSLDSKTPSSERPGSSRSIKHERPDSGGTPFAETPGAPPAEARPSGTIHTETLQAAPEPAQKPIPQPTTTAIFDNIRTQYTESLYHSKGSVAYFAKGPLSRARSAFHLDLDCTLNMDDLIEFLKGLVMTTVQIDKKYREKIPEVISAMKTLVESSDDENSRPKKRRSKKMKLGKEGFYPHEEEHVRKWWRSIKEVRKSQLSEEEAITTEEVRFHIDNLRTRETLLQVIIILEILALEPLRANKTVDTQGLPGEESQTLTPEPAPKKRNKHNFPLMLDVHADRLCIWQSTAMEVPALIGDTQFSGMGAAADGPGTGAPDPLKDFCIDVIVPFFSSRLQQQSDTLSRKLGGPPIIPSPPKPKAKPTPTKTAAKSHSRPGAITKRPIPMHNHSTNSLERALSRDRARRSMSRGPGGADPLAALRAATLPVVPKLKRENSSGPASLRDIPKASPSLREKSGNAQASMKGVTIFEDPKARKRALVEAELRDAISAIKKPSRELVSKLIVEDTERRTLSQLKKGRKPVRNFQGQQVQVKATPANFRFKDMLGEDCESISKLELPGIHIDDDCIPSNSIIPSSAPRRGGGRGDGSFFTTKVAATPLKRSASTLGGLLPFTEGAIPASSPLVSRRMQPSTDEIASGGLAIPASVLGDSDGDNVPISNTPQKATPTNSVFETPVKKRTPPPNLFANSMEAATHIGVEATPVALIRKTEGNMPPPTSFTDAKAPAVGKMSIFQKLGWDDDNDLL